ncbi:MAG: Trm112 family protein [Acidobacteriota bacterium]|nr:Trm112 family protein [Acidobacteriota bacterium]MDQ7087548.1 Trm112 family protein [Acidobacteriota bacterium]
MALQPWFAQLLVCPESKKPLVYFREENFLFCPESKLKYRIEDDIPVLLVDEAERLSDEQAAEVLAAAREQGLLS